MTRNQNSSTRKTRRNIIARDEDDEDDNDVVCIQPEKEKSSSAATASPTRASRAGRKLNLDVDYKEESSAESDEGFADIKRIVRSANASRQQQNFSPILTAARSPVKQQASPRLSSPIKRLQTARKKLSASRNELSTTQTTSEDENGK